MKTNYLSISIAATLSLLLLCPYLAVSQCTNTTAYGTVTAPTPGNSVTQNCNYATEYNTVNSVAATADYQTTSTILTDFITIRQGAPTGPVIASGLVPLSWTSTVAGTYYTHINTDAACGTASSCRNITLSRTATPMTFTSSTSTQPNTTNLDICATDAEIIKVEVVTTGSLNPFDVTQLRLRTNGSTAPSSDITNIDIYYTGTDNNYSSANLFGSAATAATGTNILVNGTQTLAEGTNYFWVTYDINPAATVGNNVDALCNRVIVDGTNRTPTVTNPAGNRTLITCARTCPTSASIFSDGFESGGPVAGVIVGTTYGSHWTGLPRTGTGHAWMNIVDGLSNLDVYERRFDGYYMGCDVTFDYWTLHNSIGFDADYTLVDDNNNVIDFNNVVTTGTDVNIYQNRTITFTPTTTGITLRIHSNSIGASGNDIALDDFQITQCCAASLPVELLSFETTCENDYPTLNWATSTEINNSYFTIERSTDMKSFEEVAIVNGNGNSSSQLTYKWTDKNPLSKLSYYRLKQTDFDGIYEYIGTGTLNCIQKKNISVYPNPTSKTLFIELGQTYEDINVEIKNVIGQVVQLSSYTSLDKIELSLNSENGIYFITISDNLHKAIYHQKIVKQ